MKKKLNDIELHIAGATVRHKSPFDDLPTYLNEDEISEEFIKKWVLDFYMTDVTSKEFVNNYIKIKEELNSKIVEKLLGYFNWQPRLTGAIFAAIKNYVQFEEQIGNLFLKSEVCDAGGGYCVAFASFNNEKSVYYLNEYLNYYLTKPDLYFDQGDAMATLAYLDFENGTKNRVRHTPQWKEFVKNKQYGWELDSYIPLFHKKIEAINKLKLL